MRWPWQDKDKDGKPDDVFGDTYIELFLAWIAVNLTALVIMGILYYVTN
jgi:hypothetical protein